MLDWVIIHACKETLKTSDYQLGLNQDTLHHSAHLLSMELFSTGSRVYTMLLEASQAFDQVNYVKLFACQVEYVP